MRAALDSAEAVYRRSGPRVRDVTAIAMGVFLTLLAVKTPWSPAPRPVILLAGTAGSLALWWRRRWPAGTTLLGVASFLLSGNPWPPMVGLSTTAAARRDLVLMAVAVVAAVGFAGPDMVDLGRFDGRALVAGTAEAAFVVAVGSYLGVRQDLLGSLRDRAERAEAERELRDEQARAGERARIAREMHDVVAHKVSLISLHAGALEVNPAADPSQIEEVAGVIRSTAHQTLEELRSVLGLLRSTAASTPGDDDVDLDEELAPQPRAMDIRRLVDSSREAGVPAELRSDLLHLADLPVTTGRAAYRLVQEGLTNVHKHAFGAPTVVAVSGDEQAGVTISVTNRRPPTTGASQLPGSGAGLVGLRERVRLVGGTLHCGPDADGGWRLEAWLPWSSGATDHVGDAHASDDPATSDTSTTADAAVAADTGPPGQASRP